MTKEKFCEIYTQFYGEPINDVRQIEMVKFNGEELFELIEHFEKFLNERNSVDEAEKPCEHNWVSSVAYKGAVVCSMCGDYR